MSIIIYGDLHGCLKEFKELSDVVVANRLSDDILEIKDKVITRDLFGHDS